MVDEQFEVVKIRSDFYRDSINKVIAVVLSFISAIVILVALFLYLHLNKPKPITFLVDNEWRVVPAVKLTNPYLSSGDMLQWVGDTVRTIFSVDYYHYDSQVKKYAKYFTDEGYKVFLNQLNIYANYNNVQMNKQFVTVTPALAPFITQQGLLGSRYVWWVSLPINLNYISGNNPVYSRYLELKVLVVRVPTLTNLNGVAIDNMMVMKSPGT